jgi:hypothetical protein
MVRACHWEHPSMSKVLVAEQVSLKESQSWYLQMLPSQGRAKRHHKLDV